MADFCTLDEIGRNLDDGGTLDNPCVGVVIRRHLPWREWVRAEQDAEDEVLVMAMAEVLL